MSEEWIVCTADIRNKIHEAGSFRPDEKIVLTTKSCVLLEHFTGKAYSYRMVDLHTFKVKRLFSSPTPLNEAGYRRAIEKMAAQSEGGIPFMQEDRSGTACSYFLRHPAGVWTMMWTALKAKMILPYSRMFLMPPSHKE